MGDFELVKTGLLSKKRWVIVLGALGFTGFGAYKVYNLPYVVKRRERLLKLFDAFISLAEMVFASAATVGIVSEDFKEFILSDSNEIPQSLKQISKMTLSNEFSDSLTRITRALSGGILSCYRQEFMRDGSSPGGNSDFSGRIMDKLFSNAGSGFAAVVVGSFARNLVLAFCSDWEQERSYRLDGSSSEDHRLWKSNQNVLLWIEAISNHSKCRELIGDSVKSFVSTAVTVYLDKTMNINTYDELFRGLTNPHHKAEVKNMMVSVCNNAVDTLIRTSHQVLVADSADASQPTCDKCSKIDFDGDFNKVEKASVGRKSSATPVQTRKFKNQSRGLASKMSTTLAVPSNRKFVIDTTGMVIYESVRSFLEFSLDKISEPLKRSFEVLEEEIIERGFVTIRYINEKSSAVATICVALFLSILNSPWIFVPY